MRPLLAGLSVLALLGLQIYFTSGAGGFAVFLNLEAFAFVLLGTAACSWAAFGLDELVSAAFQGLGRRAGASPEETARHRRTLLRAADAALGVSVLGALTGTILLLYELYDLSQLPRRLALCLDCLLYGLFLSEVVLATLAAGLAPGGSPGWPRLSRRRGVGYLAAFLATILAASAAYATLWGSLGPAAHDAREDEDDRKNHPKRGGFPRPVSLQEP